MIDGAFLVFQSALALSTGYLLVLLWAARTAMHAPARQVTQTDRLRFVVLVPAHDEQNGIADAVGSVGACDYLADAVRTVVIADNCSDATADCARRAGVEVWERMDPIKRGKGFALVWALERLYAEAEAFDAVVILDADCHASPNMLSAMDERLRSGATAVQVNYVAANPDASSASALRFAGFALTNTVRFLGKQRLGMSCGLGGTGMAFTKDILEREPWAATGLVEDAEYHMRLVQVGERSEFVPDAWVSSAVPTSLKGSSDQQARWEQGKLQVIRRWSPKLILTGLAKRDMVRVHAGLEWLVPPQSLIAAGSAGSALAGLLLSSKRLVWIATATLGTQAIYVLAGLRLVRAPLQVYRALLMSPVLIAGKVALYARLFGGKGPTSWVRTEREMPVSNNGSR